MSQRIAKVQLSTPFGGTTSGERGRLIEKRCSVSIWELIITLTRASRGVAISAIMRLQSRSKKLAPTPTAPPRPLGFRKVPSLTRSAADSVRQTWRC